MAYSGLPNGEITWAANELVTSSKMNLFSQNQADIARYLQNFDPNDGILTIKVNNTTVGTFTANDINDVDVNIAVPTTVAELSDASNYALASSIPTKVSDLTNDENYVKQSDITAVNDATLTIQKNSTTVATFSANANTNQTANITVPTNVSDLDDASSYYTKSQTDNAISSAIAGITSTTVRYEIVQVLPSTGIDTSTVYMVYDSTHDYYDQWMYINNSWAHLGTTEIDMSAYALISDIPTVGNGTITLKNHDGTLIDSFTVNQSTNATITLPNPAGTIDTAVNNTSTNPVQNKAIYSFVKDSTITIKDADATTLGSFSVNQSSNSDITIPAATSSAYGLVKIVTSTTDIGEGATLNEGTIYCVVSA